MPRLPHIVALLSCAEHLNLLSLYYLFPGGNLMNSKLYQLMNWPEIEAIVYGESKDPGAILGSKKAGRNLLVQAFYPCAKQVKIKMDGRARMVQMEEQDENGYFAALLPANTDQYLFEVMYEDGSAWETPNPYDFSLQMSEKDKALFEKGELQDAYRIFGAHPVTIDEVKGTLFTVFAPHALGVCVLGEFNGWRSCSAPMRSDENGIFELFLPGVKEGDLYCYEIHQPDGRVVKRLDPYSFSCDKNIGFPASVVCTLPASKKKKTNAGLAVGSNMISIAISDWIAQDEENVSLKKLSEQILSYVVEHGFRKVHFTDVTLQNSNNGASRDTVCYFTGLWDKAVSPDEWKQFVDVFHKQEIQVSIDLNLSVFSKAEYSLCGFDGIALYEDQDSRRSYLPAFDAMQFCIANPYVRVYLDSIVTYWLQVVGVDGIVFRDLAALLYMDYQREELEVFRNKYGNTQNLDAVAWLQDMNQKVKKRFPGKYLIAELAALWSHVTGCDEDGLGFDMMINDGWHQDASVFVADRFGYDSSRFSLLFNSMFYHYSEQFIMSVSPDLYQGHSTNIYAETNEYSEDAFLRMLLFYVFQYPEPVILDSKLLASENAKKNTALTALVRLLNKGNGADPELFFANTYGTKFDLIHNIPGREGIFTSCASKEDDSFTFSVFNFSSTDHTLRIGVPRTGRYRLIFSTDSAQFGGNERIEEDYYSDMIEADGESQSILISIPAFSGALFVCEALCKSDLVRLEQKRTQIAAKVMAAKDRADVQGAAMQKAELEADRMQQKAEDALKQAKILAEQAKTMMQNAYESRMLYEQLSKDTDSLIEAEENIVKRIESLQTKGL